ncbi:MAG: thioredoxin domain-containing protein [Gracilimonas sp.]|uniref:DsbA family protein n=1 Tax=Gracilimonas sp. TaxID=1974203 RepID=UPI0019A97102|nr:thioredoxin domain-containing protein [Gracilimonas sp.]MBD3617211.1 thioredoxin domain-containing protein [Gracilimonas sp.]
MKRGLFLLTFFALIFGGTAIAQDAGESEAKINIIKYSDYQCPACKYFVSIEEQLKEEYGSDITITTKHFPLNMHEHAQLASRAAEAARVQGKYQEMHDMIFAGQEQWARGNAEAMFIGYARSLDMDVEKFRSDMNSADMQRIVMQDKREGLNLNVNSTPTFYINGVKIEQNPRTFEAFKAIIDNIVE